MTHITYFIQSTTRQLMHDMLIKWWQIWQYECFYQVSSPIAFGGSAITFFQFRILNTGFFSRQLFWLAVEEAEYEYMNICVFLFPHTCMHAGSLGTQMTVWICSYPSFRWSRKICKMWGLDCDANTTWVLHLQLIHLGVLIFRCIHKLNLPVLLHFKLKFPSG